MSILNNHKNELLANLDKLHTTSLGIMRIKKNLKINEDIVTYCQNIIKKESSHITKIGKNWYCQLGNIIITINAHSYTIITAHIKN